MTPEEMEYRIKRLELAVLDIQLGNGRIDDKGRGLGLYLGICVNSALAKNSAPEWDEAPYVDFTRDIIHLTPNTIAELAAQHYLHTEADKKCHSAGDNAPQAENTNGGTATHTPTPGGEYTKS